MNWFKQGSPTVMFVLAALVGVGGAVGATLFHFLITLSTSLFYSHQSGNNFIATVESLSIASRLLIPTLGGLLVGIIFKYAKVTEAEGEGVPEVMEALAHNRGTIRPVVAPVKIVTAAITLGSGGSAGREGPIIQIGSAIGSSVAQFFKLDTERKSLLLAAGAAAGIGGAIGAPAAGLLFTYEILHHKLTILKAFVILLAALIGSYGARALTGEAGLRFITESAPEITSTLFFGLLLVAFLSPFIAISFGWILTKIRKIVDSQPLPTVLKPALGGLLVGIIGLYLPYIHEPAAYPLTVNLIEVVAIPLSFLFVLLIIKIIATGITLGSGGSGGIFAPLLLCGAIFGSAVGNILLNYQILDASSQSFLVLVGMATVFAAAAHAPLTASVVLVEITDTFIFLPPFILACFIASKLSARLKKESVYHIST